MPLINIKAALTRTYKPYSNQKEETIDDRISYHYKCIDELQESLTDACDIKAIRILKDMDEHEIALNYLENKKKGTN